MARATWKGAITFGLVSIPVELYPAEERKEFKFSMLDKRDFSPVGYKRYSKKSGKEVEWADVIKGYEYEKEQYVVLSDEDFRRANVKASKTIDIQAFVPAAEIPPLFFETPYYLTPTGHGEKVYALLRETLAATGLVAVAQVVIRTRQHLAVVISNGRALMLNTLRFADEIRGTTGLELPAEGLKGAHVTPKEVELAKRLVADMTEHWKPKEFRDTYHEDLMRRIEEKIKSGETKEITKADKSEAREPRSAQVIDLAALLKKSLEQGGTRHRDAEARAPKGDTASRSAASKRSSSKPALRVVGSSRGAAKTAPRLATRTAAKTAAKTAAAAKSAAKRKRA